MELKEREKECKSHLINVISRSVREAETRRDLVFLLSGSSFVSFVVKKGLPLVLIFNFGNYGDYGNQSDFPCSL